MRLNNAYPQLFGGVIAILFDIEWLMAMVRVGLNMVLLIAGRLHPKSQIIHTTSHWSEDRHHRVLSIHDIRIITVYKNCYVQYYRDVLNLWKQGRNEQIPLNSAGIRKLPPMSLPRPIGEQKEAINPPSPPELPPILL